MRAGLAAARQMLPSRRYRVPAARVKRGRAIARRLRHVTQATRAAEAAQPRNGGPPARPSPWLERVSGHFFLRFGPRLGQVPPVAPPEHLHPFETVRCERRGRGGSLGATFYPTAGEARGGVLFLHPWTEYGQAYFHRRGRLEATRRAGYHALTVDLSGFGHSAPPRGFFDRDVEDALEALRARCPGLPLHVWGVSSGGYWSHPVLARRDGVAGAMFEDVSPHLFEWSLRERPLGTPFFLCFRAAFPRSYRFLDMRRHAPHLRVAAAAYVSGADDRGVRPDDTRTLARLARAEALVVPAAAHLAAIKRDAAGVIGLALATFARAERVAHAGVATRV
jgi:pimeloyl-ACP methyl ester carboxylesterase